MLHLSPAHERLGQERPRAQEIHGFHFQRQARGIPHFGDFPKPRVHMDALKDARFGSAKEWWRQLRAEHRKEVPLCHCLHCVCIGT